VEIVRAQSRHCAGVTSKAFALLGSIVLASVELKHQVSDVECVVFDELRRGSTASPIKTVKHLVGFDHVIDSNSSRVRLAGSIVVSRVAPVHFPKALVTLDR